MKPGYWNNFNDYVSGRCFADLKFVSGASGAVPASFPSGFARACADFIASVSRSAAGTYVVTLNDQWPDLVVADGWVVQAASQATPSSYSTAGVSSVVVLQNLSNTTTKTITFGTLNGAGALTDPASGDVVAFSFQMQFLQSQSQQ